MAEAAAFVLSVIGTYDTCLAAYHLVSDIVHHRETATLAACKLSIERSKFWNWGVKWGLARPKGIEFDPSDADLKEELKSDYVSDLVMRSLEGVQHRLTDAEGLVKRYGLREESTAAAGNDNYTELTLRLKSKASELGKTMSFRGREKRLVNPVKRFRWTVLDEGKFEGLIEELVYFNAGLYQVLPVKQRQALAFALPSAVLAREQSLSVLKSINVISRGGTAPISQPLAKASSVKELSIALDQQKGSSSIDSKIVFQMRLERSWLQMPATLVEGLRSTKQTRLTRPGGPSQAVLVEWSQLNPAWSESTRSLMLRRFDNTAQLLHASSNDSTYRVLDCAGIVEEPGSNAIGFVSYLPAPAASSPTQAHYRTLGSWISREDSSKPDLGERFSLARKLALSLHQIHTSGWLHKNIRGASIAFFADADADAAAAAQEQRFGLEAPYLIGFGGARPDNDRPDAQTVELLAVPGSAFDKYLPPVYQSGGSRYRQAYDVYSFGVLLVEIARWEANPAAQKVGTDTMQKYHRRVRQTAEQVLGEDVGAIYRGVVLSCLDRLKVGGEVDAEDLAVVCLDSGEKDGDDDFVRPMDDNEWFYWSVVSPLEKCSA